MKRVALVLLLVAQVGFSVNPAEEFFEHISPCESLSQWFEEAPGMWSAVGGCITTSSIRKCRMCKRTIIWDINDDRTGQNMMKHLMLLHSLKERRRFAGLSAAKSKRKVQESASHTQSHTQ